MYQCCAFWAAKLALFQFSSSLCELLAVSS